MAGLSPNLVFENAVEAYKAETARTEAIAEAQLKAAETRRVDQATENDKLTNILKRTTIAEFKASLMRYRQLLADREREARRIAEAAKALSYYADGHRIADAVRQNCWAAYKVFFRDLAAKVGKEWASTPIDQSQACDATNWVYRSVGGRPGPILTPTIEANRLSLLDWQLEHHQFVVVKAGSYPHLESLFAFEAMTNHWAAEAEQAKADVSAIQKETYDVWQMNDFIKLTTSKK